MKERLTREERAQHKRQLLAAVKAERWGAAAFHLSLFVLSDRPGGVDIHIDHRCLCRLGHDGTRPTGIDVVDPCCPFPGDTQHRMVSA